MQKIMKKKLKFLEKPPIITWVRARTALKVITAVLGQFEPLVRGLLLK